MQMPTKCCHREEVNRMRVETLRGRIVGMYHSILKFADAVHWSNRKAYDIVNGKQQPTAKDIETMCDALKIEIPEEMRTLFFST